MYKHFIDIFTVEEIETMILRVADPDWDISQMEDVRLILEKVVKAIYGEQGSAQSQSHKGRWKTLKDILGEM